MVFTDRSGRQAAPGKSEILADAWVAT
jgi:hypothetical protein